MTTPSALLGFDWETRRIGEGQIAPPPVCLSGYLQTTDGEQGEEFLYGTEEKEARDSLLQAVLSSDMDEEEDLVIRVAHNASFDLAVAAAYDSSYFAAIFDGLISGKIHCTVVREKLLNLTEHGSPEYGVDSHGRQIKAGYTAADLMMFYFNVDRYEEKTSEDAWRTNYQELEGIPVDEYPKEARDYAIQDSADAVMIWRAQETRRQTIIAERGYDPFEVLEFTTVKDFCFFLITCRGLSVDKEVKADIEEWLAQELHPSRMKKLVESGILRPAVPPQPYKNNAKNKDGTPKMTKGKKESVARVVLQERIRILCEENGMEVQRTEKTERNPEGSIKASSEVIESLVHLDPVLEEYQHRQKLQKLVTTELPRMCNSQGESADVVHPSFDCLKTTGRSSSYASKIFPSFNCQNVHPKVRPAYKAREGFVLFSSDYNQMELGTLAQTCYNLFGESVMRDKINAGYDLHAYLGAQIAAHTHDSFSKQCPSDHDEAYSYFKTYQSAEDPAKKKLFNHYRKLAKPTGLGYPGGLGSETFVAYAKATYGVIIDETTAEMLKEIWQTTFPEMPEYFNHIKNNMKDPYFSEYGDTFFMYTSPLGLVRPNANYCAIANGMGLQTPSAEGATGSLVSIQREIFDPRIDSVLSDDENGVTTRLLAFIHDEHLGEVRDDENKHKRVQRVEEIMIESMRAITPDVAVRVESCFMTHWDKRAEPVFDDQGNLAVWHPPQEGE